MLGLLKLHLLGQPLHLGQKVPLYGGKIPLQDVPDLINFLVVVFLSLLINTRPFTVFDVVLQADFVLAGINIRLVKIEGAGPELKQFPEQVENVVSLADFGVGAEVRTAVSDNVPGDKNPWKSLVLDADVAVSLVVLQQDIVAWLVGFNRPWFGR